MPNFSAPDCDWVRVSVGYSGPGASLVPCAFLAYFHHDGLPQLAATGQAIGRFTKAISRWVPNFETAKPSEPSKIVQQIKT